MASVLPGPCTSVIVSLDGLEPQVNCKWYRAPRYVESVASVEQPTTATPAEGKFEPVMEQSVQLPAPCVVKQGVVSGDGH